MTKRNVCIAAAAFLLLPAFASADNLTEMISPVSDPTIFEDPRHSTEIRPIYLHHKLQGDFVTNGGDVNIYAVQLRAKLLEDLSFIATKDGFVDLNPKDVVPDDTGLADVALGLKYTPYKSEQSILTAGLRYEIPLGKEEVLQGQGDGAINPFLTGGYTIGGFNFMAASGLRLRIDDSDSSFWDSNLHVDYKIGSFYPLVELGMIKPIEAGTRLPISDEGQDFFNLGASGAAGKTILTASVGARYRFCDNIDAGVAYQFPLDRGEGTGIIDWRLTADMIFRFDL